ncbi:sporulation protein [Caldichromatium japonicum]|uniref:Sporulation protein n=1 Tax=Caldichromatium japonicum TaxID=2699430 RepID=A0A6G7VAE1_9GAMM|nr:AAA family ATPase [Caldichromatium japonicum]QIK36981.1 sporulation protein [Caldichromatium japonicum]
MSLDPDCLARFKLRQHPFAGLPHEGFLYSDPLLESLIETAARALAEQGALVILAGPDGAGRSVQLMRLLGALEGQYELIAFRSRPNIPFDAVDVTIRTHLRALGLDRPTRPLAELLGERAQGTRLILAIDDAHLLGSDGLIKLIRLRAAVLESGGQGLRLILVGDPALARHPLPLPDLLEDAQVVRLNLRPFNLEQAGAYLRHRLRAAGLDDPDALLSRGDIAVLQGSAKGLPAALNAQATAWLARRCRSLETGLKAVLGGRTAAAVSPSDPPPPPSTNLPDEVVELPQAALELKPDVYEPATRPSREPQLSDFLRNEEAPSAVAQSEFEEILRRVRQHQPWDTPPEPKAASREEIRAVTAKPKPPMPYWSRPWFIPLILVMVLLAIAAPVFWQLARDTRRSVSLERPAQPAKPVVVAKLQSESNPAAPAPSEPQAALASESPQPPPVLPQAGTEPAVDMPASAPLAPADDLAEDLAWLTRQDPERFTIQLVAARDLATARRVLEPHGLEGVHYIQTRSYIIAVLGSFPSRAQAARELPALPAGVRDNGPWIRTIGSIRDNLP